MAGEQIRITGGPAQGTNIEVGQELQIGRSAGTEGRLGDDPEISRQHARITRNPQGQLVVEDLGSTNGTYVNGQRITAPTTVTLADNDYPLSERECAVWSAAYTHRISNALNERSTAIAVVTESVY